MAERCTRGAPRFDRVASFDALLAAARRAARGHGRGVGCCVFMLDLDAEILALERDLRTRRYVPGPYRSFVLHQPKPRRICAAPFRDRVVHHALCAEIGPLLERGALSTSFACRPGKGVHAALRHVRRMVRRQRYALKLDIRHFFETLDHAVLLRRLGRRLRDEGLLWLVERILQLGVPGSPPGKGVPIGNLTSQYFANFYLDPLDRFLCRELRVAGHCRYMDDILIFGDTKSSLWRAWAHVRRFVAERLRLQLKDEVTRVMPTACGVPFTGFVVFPAFVRLDRARMRRWGRCLARLQRAVEQGRIDEETFARAADSLVAWAAHANTDAWRRAWVRRRVGAASRRGGQAQQAG